MKKKNELLIETKGWWEAGQEEHEKQVWHAFDEPADKPQLLYESHIFNQRFIVFQTTINYGYAAPHFLPQKQTNSLVVISLEAACFSTPSSTRPNPIAFN
jgi:hypothetical protein